MKKMMLTAIGFFICLSAALAVPQPLFSHGCMHLQVAGNKHLTMGMTDSDHTGFIATHIEVVVWVESGGVVSGPFYPVMPETKNYSHEWSYVFDIASASFSPTEECLKVYFSGVLPGTSPAFSGSYNNLTVCYCGTCSSRVRLTQNPLDRRSFYARGEYSDGVMFRTEVDWGDGTVSVDGTWHTYSSDGTKTICLKVYKLSESTGLEELYCTRCESVYIAESGVTVTESSGLMPSAGDGPIVSISLYPNPAGSQSAIQFSGSLQGLIRVLVVDGFGNPVEDFTVTDVPQNFEIGLTTANWSPGVYHVGVICNNQLVRQLLSVQ